MADIGSLSSDSDDEEYIPEGGEASSGGSDVSEGEPEDNPVSLGKRRSGRLTRSANTQERRSTRKRQKRSDKDDETSQTGQAGDVSKVEKNKSRIDDLWASFKKDTNAKGQKSPKVTSKETAATSVTQTSQDKGSSESSTKMIKVKQKYDFAGEEVVVEKEVAADSKEAKDFLDSQLSEKKTTPISLTSSTPLQSGSSPQQPLAKKIFTGSKRSSGLSSVLQSIGKKQKMSTLEKSNLDWQKYKKVEGLEEELTQHNKDGYLAKQEFLQKADLKQFELEREERLKRFRKMY